MNCCFDTGEAVWLTLLLTSLQCQLGLGFACLSYDRSKFELDKKPFNCMAELKASKQGLKQIQQARNRKGWTVEDRRWLAEASKILEPNRDWEVEGGDYYAIGVSSGTWKAFLYNRGKKGIRTETFKAYCQILGIDWEEVIEQAVENPVNSFQVNEANYLAERFSKAVQQLGSNDDWILLSSIDELEQISKDAEEKYYWRVMETLTRYVRKRSPWNKETEAKAKTARNIPPLPDDIQKVMTVLATRRYSYGHCLELYPLDLRNTDLRRLELPPKAKLGRVDFSGSNLRKADLKGVDLQEANLDETNLQGADLKGANLQQAKLGKAKLQRSILWNTNLKNANLIQAELQQACLAEADLQGAFLFRANLRGAILLKAKLQKTQFRIRNSEITTRYGLWDVVELTWEQLNTADSYEGAVLPDDLPLR
ncbi:MAG: pentapeptide repeat-containing protein [Leptolyngbya sp. BL-A-14]